MLGKFKLTLGCALVMVLATASVTVFAQNKVVVIPMSGDDAKPLANIVTVAKANGDFTDPVAAMDSISDASASNPYLIVIAPGVYPIASIINMKQYVDVSGSGQNATVLLGTVSTTVRNESAVFNGNRNSGVRSLTIRHSSTSGNNALGFYLSSDDGILIDDVRIEIDGPGSNYGIYANSSDFSLSNSTIELSDGNDVNGVYILSGVFNSHNNLIQLSDCTLATGILVNTGNANIIGNRITIDGCTSIQAGIHFNSSIDGVVSGSSIDIDSSSGNKYGIYSNSASKGLYSGLRIEVTGASGSNYGIYSNSSTNRSRITGVDILAASAAVRSSNSTNATAGHTFISNAVFREGLVDGAVSKLHCSFVFDESAPTAPIELGANCAN
ncbi:glycosyl hydrolase family 28-related protein [Arenicella xantha]|uniref:Pectate lyase-like protein n=1 Tax=Arenicella xantha TaxID=644221 RepID=A0A395JJ26_9GAMM|nr:glycosyl hydrolase family 28-related protein [Arenicella xantha]RBP50722.1 pectate lyase-like protein [Arenicella xantha]